MRERDCRHYAAPHAVLWCSWHQSPAALGIRSKGQQHARPSPEVPLSGAPQLQAPCTSAQGPGHGSLALCMGCLRLLRESKGHEELLQRHEGRSRLLSLLLACSCSPRLCVSREKEAGSVPRNSPQRLQKQPLSGSGRCTVGWSNRRRRCCCLLLKTLLTALLVRWRLGVRRKRTWGLPERQRRPGRHQMLRRKRQEGCATHESVFEARYMPSGG